MIDVSKTGKKIADRCSELGVTPKDLSAQLNTTLTAPYYWLEGKNLPKLDTFLQLANILKCNIFDLIVYEDGAAPEQVLHPTHYNHPNRKECWDEMIEISKDGTVIFDLWNAYKYLYRAGTKGGNSAEQDMAKVRNYIDHANKHMDQVDSFTYGVCTLMKNKLESLMNNN